DYGKAAKALEQQYKADNAEESARLFYVAMTRTEKSLTVTGGGTNSFKPGHGSKKGPYLYLEMLAEKFHDLVVEWTVPDEEPEDTTGKDLESGVDPFHEPTHEAVRVAELVVTTRDNMPEVRSW